MRDAPLGLKSPTEIQATCLNGMQYWTAVENDPNPRAVTESYQQWIPIEAVAKNYIRYIAAAMQLYIEHHYPNVDFDRTEDPEFFVYKFQSRVYSAPFIAHHIGGLPFSHNLCG
ncbi:MAG: hypothetical protein ACREB5_02110 [Sphingomonadaceae bacterium]